MAKPLTPNEKKFLVEYLANGNNATAAVLKVWPKLKEESARSKGSWLLTNDNIREKLDKTISDEELMEAHKKLLRHKRVDYFVFPKKMDDEEIIEKVNAAGFDVIVIKDGEKGKYAFYSNSDPVAVSKALDMGFKIKGTYAPEKRDIKVDMIAEAELSPEDKELLEVMRAHGRNTGAKAA